MTTLPSASQLARPPLSPKPMRGQIWRTQHGHLVTILPGYGPRGDYPFPIDTAYVGGKVDGYQGMTFALDGEAAMFGDRLVEMVEPAK